MKERISMSRLFIHDLSCAMPTHAFLV